MAKALQDLFSELQFDVPAAGDPLAAAPVAAGKPAVKAKKPLAALMAEAEFDVPAAPDKPWTSDLAEIGRQAAGSVAVGVPEQAGQALKWASAPGQPAYETGQQWVDSARARAPGWEPDMEGRGPIAETLIKGAQQLGPSVAGPLAAAPVVAGAAALGVPAAVGLGAASLLGAIPMGMAQAQDTYERAKEAGADEDTALRAARINQAIETGGETVGGYVGGKLLGATARAVQSGAAKPIAEAVRSVTDPSVLKPLAKAAGTAMVLEPTTEFGQGYGEAAVERAAGVPGLDPLAQGLEGAQAAVGMTALGLPFGFVGHAVQGRRNAHVAEALANPDADPAARAAAAETVARQVDQVDRAAGAAVRANAAEAIAARRPLPVDDSLAVRPTGRGAGNGDGAAGAAVDGVDGAAGVVQPGAAPGVPPAGGGLVGDVGGGAPGAQPAAGRVDGELGAALEARKRQQGFEALVDAMRARAERAAKDERLFNDMYPGVNADTSGPPPGVDPATGEVLGAPPVAPRGTIGRAADIAAASGATHPQWQKPTALLVQLSGLVPKTGETADPLGGAPVVAGSAPTTPAAPPAMPRRTWEAVNIKEGVTGFGVRSEPVGDERGTVFVDPQPDGTWQLRAGTRVEQGGIKGPVHHAQFPDQASAQLGGEAWLEAWEAARAPAQNEASTGGESRGAGKTGGPTWQKPEAKIIPQSRDTGPGGAPASAAENTDGEERRQGQTEALLKAEPPVTGAPAWTKPSAQDRPDAAKVVEKRTIKPGSRLQAVIEQRAGVSQPKTPTAGQSWGWEKPAAEDKPAPKAETPKGWMEVDDKHGARAVMRTPEIGDQHGTAIVRAMGNGHYVLNASAMSNRPGQGPVGEVHTAVFPNTEAARAAGEQWLSQWEAERRALTETPAAPPDTKPAKPPKAPKGPPKGWEHHIFKARAYAASLGIDYRGKRLADLVAEVHRHLAGAAEDQVQTAAPETSAGAVPGDGQKWQKPTAQDRPDAQKVVDARTVRPTSRLAELIEQRTGVKGARTPTAGQAWAWEKPTAEDKRVEKAPETKPETQPDEPSPGASDAAKAGQYVMARVRKQWQRVQVVKAVRDGYRVRAVDEAGAATGDSFVVARVSPDIGEDHDTEVARKKLILERWHLEHRTESRMNADEKRRRVVRLKEIEAELAKLPPGRVSDHEMARNMRLESEQLIATYVEGAQFRIQWAREKGHPFEWVVTALGELNQGQPYLSLEYLQRLWAESAPAAEPEQKPETAPEPMPGALEQARNDLIAVRARIAAQGRVVDDRLLERERQLVKMIQELEAAAGVAAPPRRYNIGDKVWYTPTLAGAEPIATTIKRIWRTTDGVEMIDLDSGHKSIEETSSRLTPREDAQPDPDAGKLQAQVQKEAYDFLRAELPLTLHPGNVAEYVRDMLANWVHVQIGAAIDALDKPRLAALNALIHKNNGAVREDVFDEAFIEDFRQTLERAKKRAAQAARKKEYEDLIQGALGAALGANPQIAANGFEDAFRTGFHHALDGGTKSNLPVSDEPYVSVATEAGYKAAAAWLQTEDGQAFAAGTKRKPKLQGVGPQVQRIRDMRAKLKTIDPATATEQEIEAILNTVFDNTVRAEAFPDLSAAGATPGTKRYIAAVRQKLYPFKEWFGTQLGGGRGKWSLNFEDAIREFLKGNSRRADAAFATLAGRVRHLQDSAGTYLAMADDLAQVFDGAENVDGAAERFGTWLAAHKDGRGSWFNDHWRIEDFRGPAPENTRGGWEYRKHKAGEDKETVAGKATKKLTPPRLDKIEREGLADHRAGKNVTYQDIVETFGFASLTVGEWVKASEAQDHANYVYDALKDLAVFLKIPDKGISLGGTLHFAVGALGAGKFAATYHHQHPGPTGPVNVINVTKTRGDGTVAHEWMHALDYYLQGHDAAKAVNGTRALLKYGFVSHEALRKRFDRFLYGHTFWQNSKREGKLENTRSAIARARKALERILVGATPGDSYAGVTQSTRYWEEANKLDPKYWGNDLELFARAGEAWVWDKLPGRDTYLVSPWVEENAATPENGYRGTPYPQGEERQRFAAAYRALFEMLQWSDTGKPTVYDELTGEPPALLRETIEDRLAFLEEYEAGLPASEKELEAAIAQEQKLRAEEQARQEQAKAEAVTMPEPDLWRAFVAGEKSNQRLVVPSQVYNLVGGERGVVLAPPRDTEHGMLVPLYVYGAESAAGEVRLIAEDQASSGVFSHFVSGWPGGVHEALIARLMAGPPEAAETAPEPAPVPEPVVDDAPVTPAPAPINPTVDQIGGLSADDFAAMFDEVLEQQAEAAQEDPAPAEVPMHEKSNKAAKLILAQHGFTRPMDWRELFKLCDAAFGGTQAEGAYDVKDAYDALELAFNQFLVFGEGGRLIRAMTDTRAILAKIEEWQSYLPTQTKRTGEQQSFQQFSTPYTYGYVMALAADIDEKDVCLEPSAGTGNLASMMAVFDPAAVVVNELSTRRAALLSHLPFHAIYHENAEHMANVLKDVRPTVVVMNPPFSQSATMGDKKVLETGAIHIEQALKRLAPGGRLVALVGRGMAFGRPAFAKWWTKIRKEYAVRANLSIDGKNYAKFGTHFDNQLLIIDKVGPTTEDPVKGEFATLDEVLLEINRRVHVRTQPNEWFTDQSGRRVKAEGGQAGGRPDQSAPAATGDVVRGDGAGGQQPGGPGGGVPSVVQPAGGSGAADADAAGGATGVRGGRPGGDVAAGTQREPGGMGGVGAGESAGLPGGASSDPVKPLAQILAEAAEHGVGGASAALTGLYELFGGGALKSFPGAIDEQTYAKAKPHFQKAFDEFLAAGRSLREFMQWVAAQFGAGIKPYLVRFLTEVAEQQSRPKAPTLPSTTPEATTPPTVPPVVAKMTDAIFDEYVPQVRTPGAQSHPATLVESAAMAAVTAPAVTYEANLPRETIERGLVSEAQLEAVRRAGQVHQQFLPDGTRRGFLIGDGTGVGKGRTISAIINDALRSGHGNGKAVWISKNDPLFKDAQRDFEASGFDKAQLFLGNGKLKWGEKFERPSGVMFATYDTIKSTDDKGAAQGKEESRVDQIVEWLGADFDGVIVFDEAHAMANAIQTKGTRGKKAASKRSKQGQDLVNRLPKARIVYVSATAATDVANLAYMDRLGLWGEGTPFASKQDFVSEIGSGGVAAMELVANNLKAMGLYVARSIAYASPIPEQNVTYGLMVHDLDDDQRSMYDAFARAWQLVLKRIDEALLASGGADIRDDGSVKAVGPAKQAAMSAFWGANQRFFNSTLTSLMLPTLIEDMHKQLEAGHSVVIQLTNTNEAAMNRGIEAARAEGLPIDDLDVSPKDILMGFVNNSFPIYQQETYTTADGSEAVRVAVDAAGNPIVNEEALALKNALLAELAQLKAADNPLDQIINEFGTKAVAEITGRSQRVVKERNADGTFRPAVIEKLSPSTRAADTERFQAGTKRILVFSEAGGTGRSYHADLMAKNQQRRIHYLLQPGWRADTALQGFGRTHRSNQANAPHYVLLTTNLKGHRRFLSSVARRLDQLGALTRGQRQTTSQGIFSAEFNLENEYARVAIRALVDDADRGAQDEDMRLPDGSFISLATLEDKMALKLRDPTTGAIKQEMPATTQFLNRLLALEVDEQNIVFDAFFNRLQEAVDTARAEGSYDAGVATLLADKITLAEQKEVFADGDIKANLVHVVLDDPAKLRDYDTALADFQVRGLKLKGVVRNKRSGYVYALLDSSPRTVKGKLVEVWRRVSPGREDFIERRVVDGDAYEVLRGDDAQREAWNAFKATMPQRVTKDAWLVTGSLLPVWKRITDPVVKISRVQTDDGQRFIGRQINDEEVDATLRNLGAEARHAGVGPADIVRMVMKEGATVRLANGYFFKRTIMSGEPHLELVTGYISPSMARMIEDWGVKMVMVGWQARRYVPLDDAPAVIERLLLNNPISEVEGGARFSAGTTVIKGELVGADGAPYRGVRAPGAPDLDLERANTGGVPFISGHSITRDEYEALDAGRVDGLFRLSTRGPETTGYQGWFLDTRAHGRTVDYRTGARIEPPAHLVTLMDRVRATRDRVGFHYDGLKGSPIEVRIQRRGTAQPADLYAGGAGFSEANIERNRPLVEGIRGILAQVAPGANVEVVERLLGGEGMQRSGGAPGAFAAGAYTPVSSTIKVALNYRDPQQTAFHEAIHFLRQAGLFAPAEWAALERQAGKAWAQRYGVTDTEEAIAYGAADFLRAPADDVGGLVRKALYKVRAFFERLAAWLRGEGFQTWDDVLRKVRAGEVGARRGQVVRNAEPLASAGAKTARPFYSALRKAIGEVQSKAMPVPGWLATIKGLIANGQVKADEVEWVGLREWLQLQTGRVTRESVLDYLKANGVQVQEVVLSDDNRRTLQDAEIKEEVARLRAVGIIPEQNPDPEAAGVVAFMVALDPDDPIGGYELMTSDDMQGAPLYDPASADLLTPQVVMDARAIEDYMAGWYPTDEERRTAAKYRKYTLPGGEGYRELLLTLPSTAKGGWAVLDIDGLIVERVDTKEQAKAHPDGYSVARVPPTMGRPEFQSAHYDQPNILAHVRFDERTDAAGERVLFVEEIQSDWAQKGKREGFGQSRSKALERAKAAKEAMEAARRAGDPNWRTLLDEYNRLNAAVPARDGVPEAPFVQKTDAWVALVLKRVIREAAERGISRVAWTTGAQQAERYDLSRQVRTIYYTPSKQLLRAVDHKADEVLLETGVTPEKLPDYLGKEAADKILNSPTDMLPSPWAPDVKMHTLEGVDLKLGGAGMRAFYDGIVPKVAKEVLKKLGGGSVATVDLDGTPQPGLSLPASAMDKALYEGQALFSRGTDQTQTPEFKRWFGDSKVVDAEGRPLVVYHGSVERGVTVFNTAGEAVRPRSGPAGTYFTSDGRAASNYVRRPGAKVRDDRGNVTAAYLSIRNPLDITGEIEVLQRRGNTFAEAKAKALQRLNRDVHDGVIFRGNDQNPDEFIVFHPNQIKSATDNVGTFDPANPDIRYSAGADTAEADPFAEVDAAVRGDTALGRSERALTERYHALKGGAKRQMLGALSVRQLAEVGKELLPGITEYVDLMQGMAATRTQVFDEADKIAQDWQKLDKNAVANRIAQGRLALVMHEATVAGADPAEAYVPSLDVEAAVKQIGILKQQAFGRSGENQAQRLQEIAQLKAKLGFERKRKEAYGRLVPLWNGLTPAAQAIYRRARDYHVDQMKRVEDALIEVIEKSTLAARAKAESIAKMRQEFEAWRVQAPYFPLSREGDYWVYLKPADGAAEFHLFKTIEQQEAFRAEQEKDGAEILGFGKQTENLREVVGVSAAFVDEVEKAIATLGNDPMVNAVRDQVYQLYLTTMPALSVRKHHIHRKKTPGFGQDALRAFAEKSYHDAYQYARLKHGIDLRQTMEDLRADVEASGRPGKLKEARQMVSRLVEFRDEVMGKLSTREVAERVSDLEARSAGEDVQDELDKWRQFADWMEDWRRRGGIPAQVARQITVLERRLATAERIKAGERGFDAATNVYNELQQAYQHLMSPNTSPVANLVNQVGFLWYLGFSPSAWMVNALQTPLMSVPWVAAKFGLGKTSAAFASAYRRAFTKDQESLFSIRGSLTGEALAAYDEAVAMGLIDRTRAHDLAGLAEEGTARSGLNRRFMGLATAGFHHAERLNREVTFVASFELARAEGMGQADASRYAAEVVWKTHLDYAAENRPRFLRGNIARMIGQFKLYSQGVTYLMGRSVLEAVKGASPEVRGEAKRFLAYQFGLQFAAAGAMGLPIGAAWMLAKAMLSGDDDEPKDFEGAFRQAMADWTGSTVGGAAASVGAVNALTPIDLHSRISLRDLWLREPDKAVEGKDGAYWVMSSLLGPMAGILQNGLIGAQLINEGHVYRGIEKMLPNAANDAAKALRLGTEGAKTLKGDELISDVTAAEVFATAVGFNLSRLESRYAENQARKGTEQRLEDRRRLLLRQAAEARMAGDTERFRALQAEIKAWNAANPERAITPKSILQSVKIRQKYRAEAVDGLALNPKLRGGLVERYQFAE